MSQFWEIMLILVGIGLTAGFLSSYKWFLQTVVVIGFSTGVICLVPVPFRHVPSTTIGVGIVGVVCGAAAIAEMEKRKPKDS